MSTVRTWVDESDRLDKRNSTDDWGEWSAADVARHFFNAGFRAGKRSTRPAPRKPNKEVPRG